MKLLLASLLAAVVSFAWGFVSWMLLDWHRQSLHDFKDEAAVAEVIKANATHGTAVYALPFPRKAVSYAAADQKTLDEKQQAARSEGPYMYAIVRPGKLEWNMPQSMALSFGRSFLAALALGALLSRTVLGYGARLAFCAGAGLFAGLVSEVPQHIWFELPPREVVVSLADHVIEWVLAGAVLGLFLGRLPTERDHR